MGNCENGFAMATGELVFKIKTLDYDHMRWEVVCLLACLHLLFISRRV